MKKNLLQSILIIASMLISCAFFKNNKDVKRELYKVIKVDSIEQVYILLATKKDTLYKICSHKIPDSPTCLKVKRGAYYPFRLKSLLVKEINGQSMKNVNLFIGGIDYYGSTILFDEKAGHDLYEAENLDGLCLKKYKNSHAVEPK